MRIYGSLRIAVLAAALLAGCGGAVSVVSEGADSNLMLRVLPYRFASEGNRRQFITNPERYAPQFGGFCAQAMAYAVPNTADADGCNPARRRIGSPPACG